MQAFTSHKSGGPAAGQLAKAWWRAAGSRLAVIWKPAQAGGAHAGQTRRPPAPQEPAHEQPAPPLLRYGRPAEAPPAWPASAPLPVRAPGQASWIAPLTSDPAPGQDAPGPPGVSGGPPWEPAPKPPDPGP